MPHLSATPEHLEALLEAALRLAGRATSGRLALARLAQAVDPLWLWSPLRERLEPELARAAQDARVELPLKDVERALRDAWGSRPTDELDDLDPVPVAVTPLAQVHRGELDGAPVAVKVQRPGIASAVRADLSLLDTLTAPLRAAFPRIDAAGTLAEVRERTLEELDLESEAEIQRRVHRLLGAAHPSFHVPSPVMRLAHPAVIVTPWLHGTPLAETQERDRAAALLVAFVVGGTRAGAVHGAPALDDFLLLPDGRLGVIDWGSAAVPDQARGALAADALDAFCAGDADAFAAALEALGALLPADAPAALELARHALGELAGPAPARLDVGAVARARERLADRGSDLWRLLGGLSIAAPDLWPLGGMAQAFAAVAQLGADGAWTSLASAALRGGWDAVRP